MLPKTKINWEDHTGLCRLAADIAIKIDDRLAPHRKEIVSDLESKLWEVCERFEYDPDQTKESTYLMRALLNHCKRKIRRQYIGEHVSWKSMEGRHFYNITEIGYATMHSNNDAIERDRRDVAEIANNVLDMIGGEPAETLERAYVEGERQVDIGKYPVIKARSEARMFVANLRNHNPRKYEECVATLGRKAV